MQRIHTLLQKLTDLSRLNEKATLIEIDLMMDYTKVIYADLIEWRNRTQFSNSIPTAEDTNTEITNSNIPTSNPITLKTNGGLESKIGINDKYLYISELFGNDKSVYEETINTLNTFDSLLQAVNWLNTKQTWEPGDEAAKSFYDTLQNHFQ